MKTKFIEVTNNNLNYGKFLLLQFTVEENSLRSKLPGFEYQTLRSACGWSSTSIWVMDLQTGEGARFECQGSAKLELEHKRVWVCPMFEPFLEWLYKQDVEDIETLPSFLDLPEAEFAFQGYRRGQPIKPEDITNTVELVANYNYSPSGRRYSEPNVQHLPGSLADALQRADERAGVKGEPDFNKIDYTEVEKRIYDSLKRKP